MRIVDKEIDLSSIKYMVGYLIPGCNYELAIVRFFKLVPNNEEENLINLVNQYICNKLSGTVGITYTYGELTRLVDEKIYMDILSKFIGRLEQTLLYNTTPDIYNIEYISCVDITAYKFIFRYTYRE